MQTLLDALDVAKSVTDRGYTFLDDELKADVWSFQAVAEEAERRGQVLRNLGLEPGDRVAMVIPDSRDFVLNFLGAITQGLVPVPMYPPLALNRIEFYLDTARGILEASEAKLLITTKAISSVLWSLHKKVDTLKNIVLVDRLRQPEAPQKIPQPAFPRPAVGPYTTCFLQFTSGSTAEPKGVRITHGNLIHNAKAIMYDGLHCDPKTDRGVSWLPLYHDMGLIGFVVAPFLAQVPVVFIPTISFVKRPNIWIETIAKYRGTITFAPNFAFGLAAKRAIPERVKTMDLSCLRVIGCGAEPINPNTLRKFQETFAPAGLNPAAIMPSYGMAEATLAVAFDTYSAPFETVRIDQSAYESGEVLPSNGPDSFEVVACGRSFPGHEVAIVAEDNTRLPEGKVGEIVFRGPSVAEGYFNNPKATQAVIRDGWLHTGDFGFQLDGRLFISGRKKDIIILNGRNYYPQSIEWLVEHIDGVRRGNVVAFACPGENTENLIVVAEAKEPGNQTLQETIKQQVKTELGLNVAEVVLLSAGALPKTSSGKLQRRKTREAYLHGTLGIEGNRTLGSAAARWTLAKHVFASTVAQWQHRVYETLTPLIQPFFRLGRGPEGR